MALQTDKWQALLQQPFSCPVYYFASTEESLLWEKETEVLAALQAAGADEPTRFDGPAPRIEEVMAAAGVLSFFGTPRVVRLHMLVPSSVKDKDVQELADLFKEAENAVFVVSCLYKDAKAAQNKKAKLLFETAAAQGFAQQLAKPTRKDQLAYLQRQAALLGTSFAPDAAEALLELAGEDRLLLKSETEKLAACANYGVIDRATVQANATRNIEADVFELTRCITAGNRAAAHHKLAQLMALRNEPVAIAAALTGTYIDMYRVRMAARVKRAPTAVFKDFGYHGNPYRLQKAKENAAGYTDDALAECILCLEDLDRRLKSSAVADKSVLLTAALGRLMSFSGRR